MDIGIKLRKLRESQKLSQPELADRLAIAQTTLCNIESGITKKVDFALMDKICQEFNVDFDYFLDGKQINNVEKNEGTIAYHVGTINHLSEKLIQQYEIRIEELKLTVLELKATIAGKLP